MNSQPDTNLEAPRERFWELPLEALNRAEWEKLCDGCARCCLHKFQEAEPEHHEPDNVWYTRVVCRYLDQSACRCSAYQTRQHLVPDCLVLTMDNLPQALHWIPSTCAYKLRYQDKPLPPWHPLLTGSDEAMKEAGIKVAGRVISEEYVHEDGLEEHVIRWVET